MIWSRVGDRFGMYAYDVTVYKLSLYFRVCKNRMAPKAFPLNYCILVWAPGLGINREASKAVCTTTSYTRITATALHCCSPLLPLFYFLLLSPFNWKCVRACIVVQNIDFSPLAGVFKDSPIYSPSIVVSIWFVCCKHAVCPRVICKTHRVDLVFSTGHYPAMDRLGPWFSSPLN